MSPDGSPASTDEAPQDPSLAGRFEESLEALEAAVTLLQQGGRSLDEMLAVFERGTLLARECEALLRVAELRVEQLAADEEPPF